MISWSFHETNNQELRCIMGNKKSTKTKKKLILVGKDDENNALSEFSKLPTKGKLLVILKWIVGLTCIFMIPIIIFSIKAYIDDAKTGYKTSDELAKNYIIALVNNDEKTLERCSTIRLHSPIKLEEKQRRYMAILDNMNVQIDESTLKMDSQKYEKDGELLQQMHDAGLDNIMAYSINIEYDETIYNDKFIGILTYELLTYELNNKWYIYDFNQTDVRFSLSEDNKNLMEIGSDELGYLFLNSEWKDITNDAPIEGTHSTQTFVSPDNTSMLTMNSYESDVTYEQYLKNYKNIIKSTGSNIIEETVTINDIKLTIFTYNTKDENDITIHNTDAFFEQPMVDGYVHEILIASTDSGKYADAYLETIHKK